MRITEIFPALLNKPNLVARRQKSWTKKGPGRVHNPLTAEEQKRKNQMVASGVSASAALRYIGAIV